MSLFLRPLRRTVQFGLTPTNSCFILKTVFLIIRHRGRSRAGRLGLRVSCSRSAARCLPRRQKHRNVTSFLYSIHHLRVFARFRISRRRLEGVCVRAATLFAVSHSSGPSAPAAPVMASVLRQESPRSFRWHANSSWRRKLTLSFFLVLNVRNASCSRETKTLVNMKSFKQR